MKRVVITGLGVASPAGNTIKDFSDNLFNGKSAIDKFDTFDNAKYKIHIGNSYLILLLISH